MFRRWFLRSLVLSELSKIKMFDLGKDPISLGLLKELKIGKDGDVSLCFFMKSIKKENLKHFKKICEQRISSLSKVKKVIVKIEGISMENLKPETASGLSQVKNIIAIASGKGGVGKSTTTMGLAYALSKQEAKVGIIDADIYGPSLQFMSKVDRPQRMSGDKIVPPEVFNIKVMSASMFSQKEKANILRGPMASQFVIRLLTQTEWSELDYLLIDYPPGTGDIQLSISQNVNLSGAVIISTPQRLALQDAKKAIYMFNTLKVPIIGAIETMSYFECDGCTKKHYIFSKEGTKNMAKEFGIPFLGDIPLDKNLTNSGDNGSMLDLDQLQVSKNYFKISRQLYDVLQQKKGKDQGLKSFKLTWQTGEK